jgi:transposase
MSDVGDQGDRDRLEALVSQLREENARLRQQLAEALERIAQLEQENSRLQQRLDELERESARQAAPFRRGEAKKVPPGERKRPGRKPGHPGAYRQRPAHVDEEIEVPLEACPCCGGPLQDRRPLVQYIEEIPPLRPKVVRLTTWQAACASCGQVQSVHPLKTSVAGGAAEVQLGPRALALAAFLNKHHGLTMRKTCAVLKKLFGLSLTPGGLSQALDRAAEKVWPSYEALREQLRGSPAVFADETSWWVGGSGWWLWTFTNPQATLYVVDESRGAEVVREVLGDDFQGMLVSDCLASYDPLMCRKHKCIAHHLRAIAKARERPDTKDRSYLDHWRGLFKTVGYLYGLRGILTPEDFAAKRAHVEQTCRELLNQVVTQPGDVAVQKRLLKHWPHLLGCLYEPAAEPTNNRAERQLRPAVIARKLSCGNKTQRGKRTWQALASLAATCQQTARDFLDFLVARLPLAPQLG